MWKRLVICCCAVVLALPWVVLGQSDYSCKEPSDFKTLESFESVVSFEASFGKYTRQCLDDMGGAFARIDCFISYEMWDREMNVYYERLMKALGTKEKGLLKESQIAWIKERDKTVDFNSALLDDKYTGQTGTMYALMRAGDADNAIAPIVKQRALLLKSWLDGLGKKGRTQ